VDVPFHRYAHAKDLSQVALEAFVDLEGIVVRANYQSGLAVDASFFEGKELRNRAVLVHTGWAALWNTERYYTDHPFLTGDAAHYLEACGVKLVGIDSHNIDDTRTKSRPVHTTLLGADILIVEHLCNLELLPDEGFAFSAAPPKFKGVGTFPVRAMAKLMRLMEMTKQ
jgi:kynurenine formamidase